MGFLADHIGLHHSFLLPLVCYLYIAYYGISGSRVREPVVAAEIKG
jgi:FHS family L-fucose permease-like MFS transporter